MGYIPQFGQAQNILTGFIPKMKSDCHIYISDVVKVSSLHSGKWRCIYFQQEIIDYIR